jgi:hypothetical protein
MTRGNKFNEFLGNIGQCIYCGSTTGQLSREHVLPFSLGGRWVLHQACCRKCRDIISAIELDVLRISFLPVRAKLNLPTRRKGKRPKKLTVIAEKAGKDINVDISIEKCPALLALPRFKVPAHIDKRNYRKGIDINGFYFLLIGADTHIINALGKELGAESLSWKSTLRAYKGGFNIARLLAKIAYGFAVAQFGTNIRYTAYILPALLGQSDDIGRWVGCVGESTEVINNLHKIELSVENGEIVCYIQLFANYAGPMSPNPIYLVNVGRVPNTS